MRIADDNTPPASDSEFQALVDQVKLGSTEAAWELVERYGSHVQRVVRRTLDHRLRSQFDSIDFTQAVWASFFREPAQLLSFDNPRAIIGYLAKMAKNKVISENRRRLGAQKRDVRRQKSLDGEAGGSEFVDRNPRPSQVAVARERWNRLVENQPERYREVVRLRLMGFTDVEIARQLQIDERTVRKIVDRLLQADNDDNT